MKTLFTLMCAGLLGLGCWAKDTNETARSQTKFPTEFHFGGGALDTFLNSVRDALGIDLNDVATVPDVMNSVRVPKLRIKAEGGVGLSSVLYLYNKVSEKGDATLGRWIMEPAGGEPQTILLVPTGPRAESSLAVRAFSLPVSNAEDAKKVVAVLEQTVRRQADMLRSGGGYFGFSETDMRGGLNYHSDAEILVASGGKLYVEMATSIIEAYKEKLTRLPNALKPRL